MKFLQTLLVITLGAAAHCASAAAAPTVAPATAINPLSVHVLNLQDGLPSAQGRIPALFPAGVAMVRGTYRVTFKTGKWFAEHKSPTFFPEIPVIFTADGSVPHYHVPLLLSPYGYSTYRGN
jgi:5-hydroxyisourate hydrolase